MYIVIITLGALVLCGIGGGIYVVYACTDWCKSGSGNNNYFVEKELPGILKKFPLEKYVISKNKYNQDTCPIWLFTFDSKSDIRILHCKHIFHVGCIVQWFTQKHNDICPMCNTK